MLPNSIQKLIDQFNKLPGIGPKTAQRLAFFLLKKPQADLETFAKSLAEAKKDLKICSVCLNISESEPCRICSDPGRDKAVICLVTDHQNLQSIERTGQYQGLYHILGGVLNPLEGINPDNLNIEQLIRRIKKEDVKEIILGLNPDLEGESTAIYLQNLLKPLGVKVTKLAKGLPSGSDIEYADEITLGSALQNRKEV